MVEGDKINVEAVIERKYPGAVWHHVENFPGIVLFPGGGNFAPKVFSYAEIRTWDTAGKEGDVALP